MLTIGVASTARCAINRSPKRALRKAARARQREALSHPDHVLTLKQWAAVNNFSVSTARRILGMGKGPPVIQLTERRIGIKSSDNAAWQASRVR